MKKKTFLNILELIVIITGVIFIFKVQFSNSTIFGADGYLHIRMAEFIKKYGLYYKFHWTRYSVFFNNFSDKDLLFHILLIPFTCFKNIFWGAKLASAIFYSFLLMVVYFFLKRYSKKEFTFLFLIMFFFSYKFIIALCRPRPFPLVIIITIISIHLLIQKRYILASILTYVYSLTHVSFPYMIGYALLIELVRFFHNKEISLRNLGGVSLGILFGFFFHPYFPNNLLIFYLNGILVPFYAAKTGVLELGAEFFPLHSREFLLSYPFFTLGMFFILGTLLFRNTKTSFTTKSLFAITIIYYLGSFLSRRYLIHGWPVFILFFSSYNKDLFKEGSKKTEKIFVGFLLIILVLFSFTQFPELKKRIKYSELRNKHYENMAYFMRRYFPKGALVFHSNWSDSQYFIGLNPNNDYFVTLDPVYMYYYDKDKYKLYRELSFGKTSDPYFILKNVFGAYYGYAGKDYFMGLVNQIKKDERFEIIKEDIWGILFKLKNS
ncbi:MAG: hypothetical protein DRP81_08460 [Candidatus Omnitrophota bacterium]|nr:MAG: hypothetical protein DRP81_08460 [Candidatus Omnitrophota bacterium]